MAFAHVADKGDDEFTDLARAQTAHAARHRESLVPPRRRRRVSARDHTSTNVHWQASAIREDLNMNIALPAGGRLVGFR